MGNKIKTIGSILGVLILTGAVGAGVYLVQRAQKAGVEAGVVALTLSSSNSNPQVGSTFVVAVSIDTKGLPVTAADIRVRYDSRYLEAQSIQSGGFLPDTIRSGTVNNVIDTNTRMTRIVVGSGTSGPKSGTGLLAQITFKAKSTTSTSIFFGSSTGIAAFGQKGNVLGPTNTLAINGPGTAASTAPSTVPSSTPRSTPSPTPAAGCGPVPTEAPTGLAPTGTLACSSARLTNVTFSWNAVSGAKKYYIRINDLTNGWISCGLGLASNPGDICQGAIPTTSYSTLLTPGRSYEWWVSAWNSCDGQGPMTSRVTITIPPVCQ